MENNSYDIPNTEGLTPEQAGQELNRISAEVIGNKDHPYTSGSHIQHNDFLEAITKLHKIKAGSQPEPQANAEGEVLAEQPSPELLSAMSDGLNRKTEEQTTLRDEGVKLVDELVEKYDLARVDVPEDVPEFRVSSWRMQKLLAEENYEGLTPMFNKELRGLQTPPDVMGLLTSFTNTTDLDPTLRSDFADLIIRWIDQANKQKYETEG